MNNKIHYFKLNPTLKFLLHFGLIDISFLINVLPIA